MGGWLSGGQWQIAQYLSITVFGTQLVTHGSVRRKLSKRRELIPDSELEKKWEGEGEMEERLARRVSEALK